MKLKYSILVFSALLALPFVSCKDDDKSDTIPPGPLSNIRFTPNNGGGYFLFDIPKDEDYLYAKAVYTLDNGQTISKTASVYSDTLYIEGFGKEIEYPVSLYAIDRKDNQSVPVVVKVKPLYPATDAVIETLTVMPGFSSLVFDWKNPLQTNLTLYVNIKSGDKEAVKAYSSNMLKDRYMIEELEGEPYTLTAYFQDRYGNMSKIVELGTVTPYKDGLLKKDTWSFLRNNLLYGNKWDYNSNTDPFKQVPLKQYQGTWRDDSLKNALEQNFEGRIQKLWDNIRDVGNRLNYFHTGPQSYPFCYYIDMGRSIRASRISIWQRLYGDQAWGGENVGVFQIWISDDADPSDGIDGWELCWTYNMVKPSDPVEANNQLVVGTQFILYPEEPQFTKPFRYLRYKALAPLVKGKTSGCVSELSIFGTEADGSIPENNEKVE